MAKTETITITFVGNKKFKQALVDDIYRLLFDEDFLEAIGKKGCSFTFESTFEPTDEKGGE